MKNSYTTTMKGQILHKDNRTKFRKNTILMISVLSFCNSSSVVSSFVSPQPRQGARSRSTPDNEHYNMLHRSGKLKNNFQHQPRRTISSSLRLKKKRPMPVVGYNAKDICDYYDRRPLVVGWRLNKLSFPLLGK